MKVLMQNRYAHTWIGGDQIQLEAALQALCALGLQVDFSADPAGDLRGYDIVHLFNLSAGWTYLQARNALRQDKPFVVSTIYQETEKSVPYDVQQQIVDRAAKLICFSCGEVTRLRKRLEASDDKIAVIPFGVDSDFQGKDVTPFRLPDGAEYVLSVGRINDKNQIRLAKICRQLDVPLVLVGEARDPKHLAELRAVGHPRCFCLGSKTREELIPIYKGAKVVACVSPTEVFPSVVMEGGLAGCHIVLTTGSASMTDWPNVELCDPEDQEAIAAAISKQMAVPRNRRLVEKVLNFTWESVAGNLCQTYERILTNHEADVALDQEEEGSTLTFRRFSVSQKRETLYMAYLLPAWIAYQEKQSTLARQILDGYLQIDKERNFLLDTLLWSLAEYARRYAGSDDSLSGSRRFVDQVVERLPVALGYQEAMGPSVYGRLYALAAHHMLMTGKWWQTISYFLYALYYDPKLPFSVTVRRVLAQKTSQRLLPFR